MRRHTMFVGLLLVGLACAGLGGAQQRVGRTQDAASTPDGGTRVYSEAGRRWFEDPAAPVRLSASGRWALIAATPPRLVSLATGREEPGRLREGLDDVRSAVPCGDDEWARLGSRGEERGWFLPKAGKLELSRIPANARVACSSRGTHLAYVRPAGEESEIVLAVAGSSETRSKIMGRVSDAVFAGDSPTLFVLAAQPDGTSTLLRFQRPGTQAEVLASGLDTAAMARPGSLAVAPDGNLLFLSLAGEGRPTADARQKPDAPRWLAVYRFDVASARLTKLFDRAGDLFSPVVVGNELFFAGNAGRQSIAVFPIAGGVGHQVVADAQLPTWSPDGRRLGLVVGPWRLADWALNLDGGAIALDRQQRAVGSIQPLIVGNHEDFSPVWSPDGRWIAYHSHRSEKPVAYYSAPGSADDIWLRSADDPTAKEIRLTTTGLETGSPDWAPDSRRMVYCGWEQGTNPPAGACWILSIDPKTGAALGSEKIALPANAGSASWAAWSPAGNEIAIETAGAGEERALWVVDVAGGDARRIVAYHGTTYGGVDWTPDGKTLVYAGLQDGRMQVFSIQRSNGQPRRISEDTATLIHPQVSPDGRWVAATRIEFRREIWKAPLPPRTP